MEESMGKKHELLKMVNDTKAECDAAKQRVAQLEEALAASPDNSKPNSKHRRIMRRRVLHAERHVAAYGVG